MRLAGNLGDESGSGGGKQMPWLRFTSISQAAELSFNRAKDAIYHESNGNINHYEDEYIDPDFADPEEDEEKDNDHTEQMQPTNQSPFNSSPFANKSPFAPADSQVHTNGNGDQPHNYNQDTDERPPDLPYLQPPTPADINSVVLSLISQGLLKGFVQHTQPDLLQSRFAIPGVRKPASSSLSSSNPFSSVNSNSSTTSPSDAWKEVGFPVIWDVISAKYLEWEGGDGDGSGVLEVPGWVTREKVAKRERRNEGGGRVIYLSGARPAGS